MIELGHEDVNYWLVVVQIHSSAKKGEIHNLRCTYEHIFNICMGPEH